MEGSYDPDGIMRSTDDITTLWRQWNTLPSQQMTSYCGTGWRAPETFMYVRTMSWPYVTMYDGGWCGWSSNPHNPVTYEAHDPEGSW